MAVLQTKTVARCKICSHERRAEIEELLHLRSQMVRDPETKKLLYSATILKEKLASEFGIENPTDENLKVHWQKHCEVVSDEEADEFAQALDEHQKEMLDILDSSDGTVDGDLRAIFKLGMGRIRGTILRGGDPPVSTDQALKAAGELTKRQDNEAKHGLLAALAGGIGQALSAPREPKQIEGAEVIDGDAVEEAA